MFKRRAPASSAPTSTVQAELRLDEVRPIRNELSDFDSEVVELQVVQPAPIVVSGTNDVPEDISASARIAQPPSAPARETAPPAELIGKP